MEYRFWSTTECAGCGNSSDLVTKKLCNCKGAAYCEATFGICSKRDNRHRCAALAAAKQYIHFLALADNIRMSELSLYPQEIVGSTLWHNTSQLTNSFLKLRDDDFCHTCLKDIEFGHELVCLVCGITTWCSKECMLESQHHQCCQR